MTEDNKINRVINTQIEENMIEEVELVEELKVVVIEKEVVLEKVTWLKTWKKMFKEPMIQNNKIMKLTKPKNQKKRNHKSKL